MVPVQLQTSRYASSPPAPVGAARPGDSRRLAAWRSLGRVIDDKDPRQVREAAALLTSQLFFAPMLAEMRKLPFGKEFGGGGRTEEVFGEQLDQRLADAIAHADGSLTTQIADRLTRGSHAVATDALESQRALWRVKLQARPQAGGSRT